MLMDDAADASGGGRIRSLVHRVWKYLLDDMWKIKILMWLYGIIYVLFSKDYKKKQSSTKRQQTTSTDISSSSSVVSTRKIVFVRHGESEWNALVTSRAEIGISLWIWRCFYTLIADLTVYLNSRTTSYFLDSTLSLCGKSQAKRASFVVTTLKDNVIFATSNLSRSIETASIVFQSQLQHQELHILSCLQEVGRGIDTLSLLDAKRRSGYRHNKKKNDYSDDDSDDNVSLNLENSTGNKSMMFHSNNNIEARLDSFMKWAFDNESHCNKTLVITGHSLWLRQLWQRYGDHQNNYSSTGPHCQKIVNCGIISFTIQQHQGLKSSSSSSQYYYSIASQSLAMIAGGYQQ